MNTNSTSSPVDLPKPLALNEPLPHRKIIRSWLIPLVQRSTWRALLLLAFDYCLLIALFAACILFDSFWLKLLSGLVMGFVLGRLFIIGHDACHQSLTDHRNLNKWLGRIAFLPSITPYSLWDVGHNVVHHGFTNLKGVDFVWAPLTQAEFDALSPARRFMERIYRSGFAPGLYYMIEIWWRRMYFPSKSSIGTQRPLFTWDCVLVSIYGFLWISGLILAAWLTTPESQSVWASALTLLFCGFIVPMLFWFAMIGFVVYVHHTHVKVSWHDNKPAWTKAQPFVSTTVHLTFPLQFGALMHHIMEHTAHHVDMSVPLYKLKEAQKRLEDLLPGRIVIQHFSWKWYFETAKSCKLYDFTRRCWTDFKGQATSEPYSLPSSTSTATN